ncbi:hypothetical protein FBZ93_104179 [Bradyrhizobium macuxiense]|uniref:Uncharacterized protein n=1 Tax=Bradyrhizobium macuxiense TaxID=1755647 RepID=A0A560LZS0_9BRAD|nr:hypothetical protein FBZ93_104179 [Bradyrhizobium macuxiense]
MRCPRWGVSSVRFDRFYVLIDVFTSHAKGSLGSLIRFSELGSMRKHGRNV